MTCALCLKQFPAEGIPNDFPMVNTPGIDYEDKWIDEYSTKFAISVRPPNWDQEKLLDGKKTEDEKSRDTAPFRDESIF